MSDRLTTTNAAASASLDIEMRLGRLRSSESARMAPKLAEPGNACYGIVRGLPYSHARGQRVAQERCNLPRPRRQRARRGGGEMQGREVQLGRVHLPRR